MLFCRHFQMQLQFCHFAASFYNVPHKLQINEKQLNRANLGWYKKRVKPHFILLQQEAENYEGKSSFLKNSQEGCPSCQYTAALEVDVVIKSDYETVSLLRNNSQKRIAKGLDTLYQYCRQERYVILIKTIIIFFIVYSCTSKVRKLEESNTAVSRHKSLR